METTCSFCGGQGKDPFGIMSYLSACCVCQGRGVVGIIDPFKRCAHCRGTGAVKTFTCTACGGKGFIHFPFSATTTCTCPECQGTGDDASAPAMACLKCRGRGWVNQRDYQNGSKGKSTVSFHKNAAESEILTRLCEGERLGQGECFPDPNESEYINP